MSNHAHFLFRSGSELPQSCNDDCVTDPMYIWFGVDAGDTRDSSGSVSVFTGQHILIRMSNHPVSESRDFFLNVALEAESCPGDFDVDRDLDGMDLQVLMNNFDWLKMIYFVPDFGRSECP